MQTPLKSILITENPWIDGSFCFPFTLYFSLHPHLLPLPLSSSCCTLQCEPTIPKNKNKQKMFIKFVTQHRVVVSHQKYTTIYIYIYRSISYLSIYLYIFSCIALYVPENGFWILFLFFLCPVLCCVPYKYKFCCYGLGKRSEIDK